MKPLPHPDRYYFDAAVGWLMLGNPKEAELEFARLNPELQRDPDLIEFKWGIHAAAKDWKQATATAQILQQTDPQRAFGWIHLAYSVRRMDDGGLPKAWEILRPAFDRFPKEGLIAYNLACYAAQMGTLDEAWEWLEKAVGIMSKEKVKAMAAQDSDLTPLRDKIARL
jgi:tetratricopeptide (TPR) repeat protein